MKSEEIYSEKSEIDFWGLLLSLWDAKLFLLLSLILSVPFALQKISKTTPVYKATAVIEMIEAKRVSKMSPDQNFAGNLGLFSQLNLGATNTDILQNVLGREFLEKVVNDNTVLQPYLKRFCRYNPPKIWSVNGILDQLGIAKIIEPSDMQKQELIVDCVKNFLDVGPYYHKKTKTSAFSISALSHDSLFASLLVQEIVAMYFTYKKEQKRTNFLKFNSYLSDQIAKAQLALKKSQEAHDDFIIENAFILRNTNKAVGTVVSNEIDWFSQSLRDQISDLRRRGDTEKNLRKTLDFLKKFTSANRVSDLLERSDFLALEGLSKSFLSKVTRIQNADGSVEGSAEDFLTAIKSEIIRIENLTEVSEEKFSKSKQRADLIFKIQTEFSKLQFDIILKSSEVENLRAQLTANSFETGAETLYDDTLHSRAVQPIKPISPNKIRILIFYAFFFFIFTSFLVIVRQGVSGRVFSLAQLKGAIFPTYLLKMSQKKDLYRLNQMGYELGNKLPFGVEFLYALESSGRLGCIVDITDTGQGFANTCEDICSYLANILELKGRRVVHLKDEFSKKSSGSGVSFLSSQSKTDDNKELAKEEGFKHKVTEKFVKLSLDSLKTIKDDYEAFDNILIALDGDKSDMLKFEIIEKCDFYILVGRVGKFNVKKVKRFSFGTIGEEKKCIGLFLLK